VPLFNLVKNMVVWCGISVRLVYTFFTDL